MSIEDIILDRDSRGVSKLRGHLPANFCQEAAELILANPGTALIATGFYILASSLPETDGPPGALAIQGQDTAAPTPAVFDCYEHVARHLHETLRSLCSASS